MDGFLIDDEVIRPATDQAPRIYTRRLRALLCAIVFQTLRDSLSKHPGISGPAIAWLDDADAADVGPGFSYGAILMHLGLSSRSVRERIAAYPRVRARLRMAAEARRSPSRGAEDSMRQASGDRRQKNLRHPPHKKSVPR